MARYHVSVTGLRLKGWFHVIRFWRHAAPSFRQVKDAEGIVMAKVLKRGGVHHTLTVWESETAMKRFLYRGAHRMAIKAFPAIASGTTCSFPSDVIPSWDEALEYLAKHGRFYSKSGAEA
ncbi:hypothetical protein [uncultured Roseibium sp.]|uniref:hypothetical protein n=1 Tax=uncultured Roseibium sp. TaxID=1936171 RepID=UPI002606743B|nr:hypothetical protein [uncultured Roseibium sp.]